MKIGNIKTVYKEEKHKETGPMIASDESWAQNIRILFKYFPEIKKEKIGDDISIMVSGSISIMDEKGVSIKVVRMAMCEMDESDDMTEKKKEVDKPVKSAIMKEKPKSEKLGKIFGK